jgi:hypothetical protein
MDLEDEEHLFGALLHGESSGGSGRYNNLDQWSVSLSGQESVGARLVTVHEALHVVLNDSTATGIRLAACAVLARAEGDQYVQTLKRLVSQCRGVHEAFATFESLWLVALGDRSYLQAYPRYLSWYKDAAELIPLPDHLRRKEMLLDAAISKQKSVMTLASFMNIEMTATMINATAIQV